ncbi:hypothetical protein TDB9533_04478 [Thalassocella blandensis]|nr:hypothetical protein TDB9533_04478 [Thalassocella blandensis]
MKKQVLSAAIAALLGASHVHAGDTDVFVFLDNNPLQGVDVRINGTLVGQTDDTGEATTYLDEDGKKSLVIEKNGEQLASHEFGLNADEDAEISIVLSKQNEPKVHVYKSGQSNGDAIGFLRGQVRSPDGKPLAGANVSIPGTEFESTTGVDGSYSLDLPRGSYELSIYHPDFATANYNNVRIIANVGTAAVVTMKAKDSDQAKVNVAAPDIELGRPAEEVLILGHFNAAQESSFTVEQMSTSVVDAIDIGEIQRMGDSDVGAIVKRVVGVSIVDDKYAVVRGLDGRYISATLNKVLMPTTNAFKRDAELDLFPSDILGGLEIQKSFSADLPAESTAGTILIKTRKLPTDFTNKISATIGMTSGVTGDDILTYEGSDSDYWGTDDGLRELPSAVYAATNGGLDFSICQIASQQNCVQPEEAAALANSLPNTWNTKTETAAYDYSIGYTLGQIFDLSFGSFSFYASGEFGKDTSSKQDAYLDDPLGQEGEFDEDKISTDISTYLVSGFTFNDDSYIDSKTIFLRNSDDTARFYSGVDNSEDSSFSRTILEWKEREFFGQYFSGFHYLFETHELDWRIGFSETNTTIPDRRSYLYLGDFLAISTVERLYADLNEEGSDFGLDYKMPFDFNQNWRMDLKLGVLYNKRDRTNEQVRLGYRQGRNPILLNQDMESLFSPENINNDAFRILARSTDTDAYNATQEQSAVYLASETHYNESVSFIVGVRQETFEQNIELPNVPSEVQKETDDMYPSLGVIYRPTDAWQLRFNLSETISRPTLTELAPARFYDDKSDEYIGNPNLEASEIQNIDFRLDYYFPEQGSVSIALFNKFIDKPVEVTVVDGSGSASNSLTWRNEDEATLLGLEIDLNKEFLNTNDFVAFVGANLTFIDSEVVLTGRSADLQKESERELQGQSPFLANIQLGFDHFETAQKFTFLVNYFDDRIYKVTRAPNDLIYEKGRATVDFNYEIGLFDEKAALKAKVKNITNEKVEFTQGDNSIEGWEDGVELSVGFSYNF